MINSIGYRESERGESYTFVRSIRDCFRIKLLAFYGLFVALPKFTLEGFWMLGILWAHVIIIAGILYLVAAGINWLLFRLLPSRAALFGVLVLIVVLFVASTFEIYRLPGHNSAPPANLLRVTKDFFR